MVAVLQYKIKQNEKFGLEIFSIEEGEKWGLMILRCAPPLDPVFKPNLLLSLLTQWLLTLPIPYPTPLLLSCLSISFRILQLLLWISFSIRKTYTAAFKTYTFKFLKVQYRRNKILLYKSMISFYRIQTLCPRNSTTYLYVHHSNWRMKHPCCAVLWVYDFALLRLQHKYDKLFKLKLRTYGTK